MSTVLEPEAPPKRLTIEEFLALPDDGMDRELIRGVLRERPASVRDRHHTGIASNVNYQLMLWRDHRPKPRGQMHIDAGFRLKISGSVVGIDVAFVSAEMLAATDPEARLFDGPPVLAVEILSPSDTVGDVADKVAIYNEAGAVAWVVDPFFRRVTVHRPGEQAESLHEGQELSGDPYLPGFRVPVALFFED